MKTIVFALMALISSTAAFADGFVCQTADGQTNLKVYNHTNSGDGTRTAAIMVLSDNDVSQGRKTIAVFQNTLAQNGAHYTAVVDLRYLDSSRKGENVFGTKLGYLKSIDLDVDFNYNNPVNFGKPLAAEITANLRNGSNIVFDATCYRYLKN